MFKTIRMFPLVTTLIVALLLSACSSALGNVSFNDLILTATALSGTTVPHFDSGTDIPKLTGTSEATEVFDDATEMPKITGTPVVTEVDSTGSPEDNGTPRGSVTPKATNSEGMNGHEVFGVVQAYTPGTSITINGVAYTIISQSVISKCDISTGTAVHLEFGINPDGTFYVHHLGLATGNRDCNGNSQGQNNQGQNGQGDGSHNGGTPLPHGGDGGAGGG